MAPPMQAMADERRLHPRRAVCHPLAIELPDGTSIPCESVDVSVGGMKVRSSSRIPVGPADVVISADGADALALRGEIVEELIDASTGEITARIVFLPAPRSAIEQVITLPGRAVDLPRSRRRTVTVLAASIVAGILVAGGAYAATRGEDAAVRRAVPAATAPTPSAASARVDAPPHVLAAPVPVPAPLVTPALALGAAASPAPTAPRPSSGPAQTESAPAPAPRVERTDDVTRVVVGATAEETSVQTASRPSAAGDDVRMQLHVTPEPDGTILPVAVRLENRSAETLRFPDGLQATVTATRDGADDAVTTLAADVTRLAPGESFTIEGFLDFGATGEYDVTATAEVH